MSDAGLTGGAGTICWLKGFGEIKVLRVRVLDGTSEYWAKSLREMTEAEREMQAKAAWRIEMYHRALKQQCLIERARVPENSTGLESHRIVSQSICAN